MLDNKNKICYNIFTEEKKKRKTPKKKVKKSIKTLDKGYNI